MSKYLDSLNSVEYDKLVNRLFEQQNGKCFICEEEINLDIHKVNVDHIIPLVNNGKDDVNNFGLTHEVCNKSKLDADLKVAKVLNKLEKIQKSLPRNESASLKHVLKKYDGEKYNFSYVIEANKIKYTFNEINDLHVYEETIYTDLLSGERSAFIEIPIEYLFHDELINPRGINNSISLLVKEFYKGNPQLHLSLARIHEGKIKIFDGQHKAVAQILLGVKKLVIRVFVEPDIERLIETNTNAGSKLKQIAFDKSIVRQLHDTLYAEKIKQYQLDHNLENDDYSFSEQNIVDYFKSERGNIRSYIINSMKNKITYSDDNKLLNYIDFGGKAKELPLSYSSFEKTFLSLFINPKKILSTPINDKEDIGLNPRMLEHDQLINLCNIIAEEVYIDKFNPEIGVFRIENKICEGKDIDITDNHLIAYRLSKEEIMVNWLKYIRQIIIASFSTSGLIYNEECLFQQRFPEQVWINIRRFIKNFASLPVWKNRSLSNTIFAGKTNYDYWKNIFETGNTGEGVAVLAEPINWVNMIRE